MFFTPLIYRGVNYYSLVVHYLSAVRKHDATILTRNADTIYSGN